MGKRRLRMMAVAMALVVAAGQSGKGNPDTGECDGCTEVRRQSEGGSAGAGQRPGTGRSFLHLKNKNTATFCPTIASM